MIAALADALVVVAALWALSRARSLVVGDLAWRAGLALVALAATVGTLRYAALPSLAALHATLSLVAAALGMPSMAAGLYARARLSRREGPQTGFALGTLGGVTLTAFATLVVGDTGEWHGFARENLFHVLFASALVSLGAAYELT